MRGKKRLRKILIGIDSSENLSYSMVVAGPDELVGQLNKNILDLLKTCDIKVSHFKKIDKKILRRIEKAFVKMINSADNVSFRCFEHVRPLNYPKKRYFLKYIPEKIADYLAESFDGKNRLIQIEVHNDYRVARIPNSNSVFMRKLIDYTSRKLNVRGFNIKIKTQKHGFEISDIISKKGKKIKIIITCKSQQNSKAINVADFTLGLYKNHKKQLKVKHEKI